MPPHLKNGLNIDLSQLDSLNSSSMCATASKLFKSITEIFPGSSTWIIRLSFTWTIYQMTSGGQTSTTYQYIWWPPLFTCLWGHGRALLDLCSVPRLGCWQRTSWQNMTLLHTYSLNGRVYKWRPTFSPATVIAMFSIKHLLRTVSAILALTTYASALGTSCTAPLGAGTSGPNDPFWMQSIKHQGKAPLNSFGNGYTVFRSAKVLSPFIL